MNFNLNIYEMLCQRAFHRIKKALTFAMRAFTYYKIPKIKLRPDPSLHLQL